MLKRVCSALLVFSTLTFGSWADPGQKILVLYKDRDANHENIVAFLTGFLKQAGYEWDAKDVESFMPSNPDMSPYRGIMTCYLSSQMVGGDKYAEWMDKQLEAGKKVAIIGSYGAYQGLIKKPDGKMIEWNESTRNINSFLWPFGLEFYFGFTADSSKLHITKKDKQFAEFQAKISDRDLNYYQLFKSRYPESKVYLSVNRSDMLDAESAFILHTPYGGMILEGFGYFWDTNKKAMVQRVDMVSFLKGCFEGQAPPIAHYDLTSHDELYKNPLPEKAPPQYDPYTTGQEKRHILVIYKKSEAKTLEDVTFFNRGDLVVNYLGGITDYRAVEDGLPGDEEMERYRGIVVWEHTPTMVHARDFEDWLLHQMEAGKRVAMLENYAAIIDSSTQARSTEPKRIFQKLGVDFGKLQVSRYEKKPTPHVVDPTMIGFAAPGAARPVNPAHIVADLILA